MMGWFVMECKKIQSGMQVARISFKEFLVLKDINQSCVVMFTASWARNRSMQNILDNVNPDITIKVLFEVVTIGRDDVENYIVDVVKAKILPIVCHFHSGELDGTYDVSTQQTTNALNQNHTLASGEEHRTFAPRLNSILMSSAVRDFNSISDPICLFIAGDKSSVGKSSTCLAILASLVRLGVDPAALAYIKPVTQCEAEQPITVYCEKVGIAHRSIGPVVFYKGFTRAFLAKETEPSDVLLQQAVQAVHDIGRNKRLVLVDGVGYPSVGSICGLSNADVASALKAPVLLVGKAGVGDAVDSYNLNASFFEGRGVKVLGGIFNKLPLSGFYSLEACKEAVRSYFSQYKPHQMPYGFIPLVTVPETGAVVSVLTASAGITEPTVATGQTMQTIELSSSVPMDVTSTAEPEVPVVATMEDLMVDAFMQHCDLDRLIYDAYMFQMTKNAQFVDDSVVPARAITDSVVSHRPPINLRNPSTASLTHKSTALTTSQPIIPVIHADQEPRVAGVKRSREEVERSARQQGATGG